MTTARAAPGVHQSKPVEAGLDDAEGLTPRRVCTKATARWEPWATAKAGIASCHAPKQARCRNFGQWRKLAPRLVMHQSEHTAASLVDAEDRRRAGRVPKQRRRRIPGNS